MSFEIGDRVQQIRLIDGHLGEIGELGTVNAFRRNHEIIYSRVTFDNHETWWCKPHDLGPATKPGPRNFGEFVRALEHRSTR